MSVIDMIIFKIKKIFWIRKTAELLGPPPVLCPKPTGGSQPTPRRPPVFLKPLRSNFVRIRHWLVSVYTSWKHQKIIDVMFLGGIERNQWHKCANEDMLIFLSNLIKNILIIKSLKACSSFQNPYSMWLIHLCKEF